MNTFTSQKAFVNGANLEFATRGKGEPILFIHGAIVEAFVPLLNDAALADFQLITYARRGYGQSERTGTIDIPTHARDVAALLDHLGIERAHIVAHSYGPLVALELALQQPERVHSLILLETAVPGVLLGSPAVGETANQVYARYQQGDVQGAFDTFFGFFLGAEFRELIDRSLPGGALEREVANMPTLLENDFPALQQWAFGPEQAQRITQPTLLVIGGETLELFREAHRQLELLLPTAETFVVPGTAHELMMGNARDTARGVADFCARHPLRVYA